MSVSPILHYAGDDLIVTVAASDSAGPADLGIYALEGSLRVAGHVVARPTVQVVGGKARMVFARDATRQLGGADAEARLHLTDGHGHRTTIAAIPVCVTR